MTTKTWITDDNGNRASVEYFGSEEAARAALASLHGCDNCTNCEGCSSCFGCTECSRCVDCSDCIDCMHCSTCHRCADCADCADCSGMSKQRWVRQCIKFSAGAVPVPRIPRIHTRIYARASQPGALCMSGWHACDTTHCRAGWVVHEAGEAGYALERFHDTELAAMLIYRASGYEINPARFYDSADDAMADMKRLAESEQPAQRSRSS